MKSEWVRDKEGGIATRYRQDGPGHEPMTLMYFLFSISIQTESGARPPSPKTTDVVIQQHSLRLLKMDILMSETCWAHKKWNKIASDIKLVFHSSTIEMMHGKINIRYVHCFYCSFWSVWRRSGVRTSSAVNSTPGEAHEIISTMFFPARSSSVS